MREIDRVQAEADLTGERQHGEDRVVLRPLLLRRNVDHQRLIRVSGNVPEDREQNDGRKNERQCPQSGRVAGQRDHAEEEH